MQQKNKDKERYMRFLLAPNTELTKHIILWAVSRNYHLIMNVCGLFSCTSYSKSSKMKTVVLTASILLFVLSATNSVHTQETANSCDGISNDMRSQICLSGQCPLKCGYVNSSQYSQCDQVCVLKPCASLSCKTSNCVQRCLSGGCNTMMCSSTDCTQTCLGNCTAVNCTATSKCNQQCEKGKCNLLAIGGGVTEQTCAENCGLKCSEGLYGVHLLN